MKKITLLFITLFAIQSQSFAQCENQHISISSQQEANNFSINYPGCTIVKSLGITATEILNLDGLSQITTIIDDLAIVSAENTNPALPNYPLTEISGLDNITTVGGTIYLSNFPNLTTTDIFHGLTQAGGISISELTPEVITGFFNLLSLTGELKISYTNASRVIGFGFLYICEDLIFVLNPNLQYVGGFDNLYQINNYLNIGQNPMLLSVPSLPALTDVLGDFVLNMCPIIENMEGVENLENVDRLIITNNNGLTTLHGLENLETVGTAVHIHNNPNLSNCAINFICEEIAVSTDILSIINNGLGCNSAQNIEDNCNLETLDIVLSLQAEVDNFSDMYTGGSAVGSLRIEGNEISNLDGLSQLTTINGDLNIASALTSRQELSNYPLTDISGLNNITTVAGMVELSDVPNLTTANSFNALEETGSISISGLTPNNISGFNNLVTTGLIEIQGTTISSFSGLNSLSICSDLIINNNQNLETFSGLLSLNQITNDLKVEQNPMLQNLQGMENLQSVGHLSINSNVGLSSFNGLENLESVGTQLQINANPLLNDLTALSNVVEFYGNTSVITIQDNALLSDLSGLHNIAPLTIDTVVIQNNPNLSNCAINNFCAIDSGGGGQFTIANNASGCNNVSEIQAICVLGLTENLDHYFSLFPNPSNTILNVQTHVEINSVKITDITGRTTNVNDFDNNTLDVSNLAAGVYFIQFNTSGGSIIKKFIKN